MDCPWPGCGLQGPSAVRFQSDDGVCDGPHMQISCIFMVLANYAPHQPPRGRAAALGGPAVFAQIRWAPPGREVRRGVCRSRFFICACACDGSYMRISWFLPIIPPTTHPTGVPRPWMARPRLARRAGLRQYLKYDRKPATRATPAPALSTCATT